MELPRADWLKPEHLDALKAAIGRSETRTERRRLQEVVALLVQAQTRAMTAEANVIAYAEPEAPIVTTDLDVVRALLAKGVQHNGMVPDMSPHEVGRAMGIAKALLTRAALATLAIDDLDCLEWTFTVAAEYEPETRADVRRVEKLVRLALGLPPRLTFSPRTSEEVA